MDKKHAFEKLDSVRADSDDLADPEFADAARVIENNAAWEMEFHNRQVLDRQICDVMQDVPVPADLKQKLFAQAGLQLPAEPQLTQPPADSGTDNEALNEALPLVSQKSASRARFSRRAFLAASVAGLAVSGWWFWQSPAQLTSTQILSSAPLDEASFSKLTPYNGSLSKDLPYADRMNQPAVGWSPTADAKHRAAMFQYRGSTGKRCVLLIVPYDDVADASAIVSAATHSATRGAKTFVAHGWNIDSSSSPCICVLFVENGLGNELDQEMRRLTGVIS